ncbi:L-glutamate gamma-semialdehyde dehydrogenase [Radiobacillus kanasensis]|uniref:L-glutamate gamma-semialdehyde dehydrogenase n=1 Tax=Radiobacillus kanasensis TaxID=2844358 RepID=UPI001E571564|nr:L-glutamate gamma-semialdehyde dehydrogenase [Radiobacillus kanasensis]UFU00284.1 L-glutamate gamma-semialdehyde dehydrogenase [Radiobacillus kanasensis]
MLPTYKHEPFLDFTVDKNREELEAALKNVEKELGKNYPLIINGERIETNDKFDSVNPANKAEVIGYASKATTDHVEKAFTAAEQASTAWALVDPEQRANILVRAAAIIRRRKAEFSALLIKEAGKPWKEADADIAEGIDFLEYYARQMIELKDGKPLNSRENEHNRYIYTPAGITVVIPPWNFAFAIMVGTTVAPLVAGNTVLLKPAEPTPIIAYKFFEVLEEAGLPNGVANFITGDPAEIGDYMVDHPKTAIVTFTGSRATGTRLYNRASVVQEGQKHLKKVIAEMGGKDTVVVDEDADLELAAESILVSAFGFSGQKCSAGSRAVVHEKVYDQVLNRVVEMAKELSVGNPAEYGMYMGPVVNQKAFDKITSYIEIGKEEGKLVAGGSYDDSKGWFVDPTIFADVDPKARIMQEEIFGPVLAFSKAKDFDEALEIANNTEYGLTGAVITKNRDHIEKAKYGFHVGNLYFNRNCTGAIVGYHPFGGFKMSGTDSKAGGPDYLILYMNPKTVSEMY